uniref:Toxin CptA n=1 Tax=Candidatus Kentrum sp. SD TaxID=2126332 RepID=A0A450YF61_9GAMM|nr:MAG: hypothetical protein BECKSD772F_GA0070984_10048 [Candidatus Kentron sp. SD]VFK40188.1 MAG: hypothetical protein BECKSD772E_GA0070983_10058 [Candidatus Kentron sp. SD]
MKPIPPEKSLHAKQRTTLQPIRITLHRSWYLASLLFFAHVGALGCLVVVELALSVKLIVGAIVVFNMFFSTCEHAFRCSRSSIITLLWTAEGVWQLWTRGGQVISVDLEPVWGLRPTIYVHSYLVVLNFNTGRRLGKQVVLLPDMVDDTDAFRRLRIRLRFG